MSRERWFRGDRNGRERPLDWYALAREYGIGVEQARALYEEAVRRVERERVPQSQTEPVYIELLENARLADWRPSPGKITRTMRLQAERSGQKRRRSHISRLTGQPIAPGKRTLTSYLAAPRRQQQEDVERQRLEAMADVHRALGLPIPEPLARSLERFTATEAVEREEPETGLGPEQREDSLEHVSGNAEPEEDLTTPRVNPSMHLEHHAQPVQRKRADERADVIAALPTSSSGQPLPEAVRAKMEHAFDADFSAVRIHEGPEATMLGALAYTQGTEIHFAPGWYDPHSQAGQELLGHELTHVVQQAQGRSRATGQIMGLPLSADPALEREADELGARASRGERMPVVEQAHENTAQRVDARAVEGQAATTRFDPAAALGSMSQPVLARRENGEADRGAEGGDIEPILIVGHAVDFERQGNGLRVEVMWYALERQEGREPRLPLAEGQRPPQIENPHLRTTTLILRLEEHTGMHMQPEARRELLVRRQIPLTPQDEYSYTAGLSEDELGHWFGQQAWRDYLEGGHAEPDEAGAGEVASAPTANVEEVLRLLAEGRWDVDTLAGQLTDAQLRTLSADDRVRLLDYISNGHLVGNDDEATLVRLLATTPAEQARSVRDRLGTERLQQLDAAIDFDEYRDYHSALRELLFLSLSPREASDQMASARVFPWADPGIIHALWNVRFYYEEVELHDDGKLHVRYWMNLAFLGRRAEAVQLDPFEMIAVHFLYPEEYAGAERGQTLYMPAINLRGLHRHQFRNELQTAIDVGLLAAGGAGLASAGTRLARAIAALDLAISAADLTIRDFRHQIAQSQEGRDFLVAWDRVSTLIAIYGVTRAVLGAPQAFRHLRSAFQRFRSSHSSLPDTSLPQVEREVDDVVRHADEAEDAAANRGSDGSSTSTTRASSDDGSLLEGPPRQQDAGRDEGLAQTEVLPGTGVARLTGPLDPDTLDLLKRHGCTYDEATGIASNVGKDGRLLYQAYRVADGRWVYTDGANTIVEYEIQSFQEASRRSSRRFFNAHHALQDRWAKSRLGELPDEALIDPGLRYRSGDAPTILLRDRYRGSPHQRITARQAARSLDRSTRTYAQERANMIADLEEAGIPGGIQQQIISAVDEYFQRLKNNIKDPEQRRSIFGD